MDTPARKIGFEVDLDEVRAGANAALGKATEFGRGAWTRTRQGTQTGVRKSAEVVGNVASVAAGILLLALLGVFGEDVRAATMKLLLLGGYVCIKFLARGTLTFLIG